jgi:hypothetical protein
VGGLCAAGDPRRRQASWFVRTPTKRPIDPPGFPLRAQGAPPLSGAQPGWTAEDPYEAPHRAAPLRAPPRRGDHPASTPTGKPVCFYSARRVSAGISSDRLRTMEQKIEGEIRSQLEMARPPGQTTPPSPDYRPLPLP